MQESDNHTLYIRSEYTKIQFEEKLTELFAQIIQYVKDGKIIIEEPQLNFNYRLNYVCTAAGEPVFYSYVYLCDSRVFHILLNKKPDGTDNVIYTKIESNHETKKLDKFSSWLDDDDDVPLVKTEKAEDLFIYNEVFIPKACVSYPNSSDEVIHVLTSKVLPEDITETDLKNYLSFYHHLEYNINIVTTFNGYRYAYIVCRFGDNSLSFLYQMLRYFTINKNDKSYFIAFVYAKTTNHYVQKFPFRYEQINKQEGEKAFRFQKRKKPQYKNYKSSYEGRKNTQAKKDY